MAEYNERVAAVATDILSAVQDRLEKNDVSHAEYRAAWKRLAGLAQSGEVPLFLDMIGRHSWRPAHFHFIIRAAGHEPLTTQLYFRGDPWLEGDGDVVGAVKDPLIVDVGRGSDPQVAARYGIEGDYQTAEYTFALRTAG